MSNIKKLFFRLLKETDTYNVYFNILSSRHKSKNNAIISFNEMTKCDSTSLIESSEFFTFWVHTKQGKGFWTTLNLLWHLTLFENGELSSDRIRRKLKIYHERIQFNNHNDCFITEKDKIVGQNIYEHVLKHMNNNKTIYKNIINSL